MTADRPDIDALFNDLHPSLRTRPQSWKPTGA